MNVILALLFLGWQPRWFVLEGGTLSYYDSQEDAWKGCKGSIKISVCEIQGKFMPSLSRKPNNHYITSRYSFYASWYHNSRLRKLVFLHLWELVCPRGWFSLELTFSCFCLMKLAVKLSWGLLFFICIMPVSFYHFIFVKSININDKNESWLQL